MVCLKHDIYGLRGRAFAFYISKEIIGWPHHAFQNPSPPLPILILPTGTFISKETRPYSLQPYILILIVPNTIHEFWPRENPVSPASYDKILTFSVLRSLQFSDRRNLLDDGKVPHRVCCIYIYGPVVVCQTVFYLWREDGVGMCSWGTIFKRKWIPCLNVCTRFLLFCYICGMFLIPRYSQKLRRHRGVPFDRIYWDDIMTLGLIGFDSRIISFNVLGLVGYNMNGIILIFGHSFWYSKTLLSGPVLWLIISAENGLKRIHNFKISILRNLNFMNSSKWTGALTFC